jgi:beta-lactamase superfamily II metal-dependent hydrolase
MARRWIVLLSIVVCGAWLSAQSKERRPLEIYVVDVEGSKADLWITPAGQTLLIDTGTGGGRDVGRILEVMKATGVTKLDYLITTHYHGDHAGGLEELAAKIPIAHFVDHGENIEPARMAAFMAAYPSIYGKGQRTIVKPGDRLPITGLDWRIVTAGGKVVKGGKRNPHCAGTERRTVTLDPEDGQSIGSLVTYGSFRTLDFGDMTWDIEHDLMCPNNPLGTVDLYFVSDHGLPDNSAKEFIYAIQPRVAIVQNSATKGNSIEVLKVLRTSPGFEDLWQAHWGNAAGTEWNSPGLFIANGADPAAISAALLAPPPAPRGTGAPATVATPAGAPGGGSVAGSTPAPGTGVARSGGGGRGASLANAHTPAPWIKVTVQADGHYTVTNSRNDFSKTYAPRSHR